MKTLPKKLSATVLPRMTATGKRRLRKLIAHLRIMPKEQFDFEVILKEAPGCGTTGCAIGETPKLFPRLVKVVPAPKQAGVVKRFAVVPANYRRKTARQSDSVSLAAGHLFGIDPYNSEIFIPNHQWDVHCRLPICAKRATPKAVAAMLSRYIALTETPA